jgi:hypothetical protein
MASNGGDLSASTLTPLLAGHYRTTEQRSKLVFLITPWHGPTETTAVLLLRACMLWMLPSNGCLQLLLSNVSVCHCLLALGAFRLPDCEIGVGPYQHSDSWIWVPWDPWSYFTVLWLWEPSDYLTAKLLLVFISIVILGSKSWSYSLGTSCVENTVLLSNGEAVLLLLHVHSLPRIGV